MRMRGTGAVTFALEATRTAIKALVGKEVADFTAEYSGKGSLWEDRGFDQRLAELNEKACAPWKNFDLHDSNGELPTESSDSVHRWFYLDVLLFSGTEVHAEWCLSRGEDGEWQDGLGRVEIQDDASVRGGRPYEVKVQRVGYDMIAIYAQRYTGFGVMANPTRARSIQLSQ